MYHWSREQQLKRKSMHHTGTCKSQHLLAELWLVKNKPSPQPKRSVWSISYKIIGQRHRALPKNSFHWRKKKNRWRLLIKWITLKIWFGTWGVETHITLWHPRYHFHSFLPPRCCLSLLGCCRWASLPATFQMELKLRQFRFWLCQFKAYYCSMGLGLLFKQAQCCQQGRGFNLSQKGLKEKSCSNQHTPLS